MKKHLLTLFILLFGASTAFAGSFSILGVNRWKSDLSGNLKIGESTRGNKVELDLGSEAVFGKEKVTGFTYKKDFGNSWKLGLSYVGVDHDTTFELTKDFEFDNKVYQLGNDISMSLENTWFDISASKELTKSQDKNFNLDGTLGVKISKSKIAVSGTDEFDNQMSHSWDETIPVPYIGLALSGELGEKFTYSAHYNWLEAKVGDYDASFKDIELKGAIRLNEKNADKEWFFYLAKQKIEYDIEGKDNKLVLDYSGPVFGLEVLF